MPGDERKATASELAERIKALKAATTIDATPERLGKRCTSVAEAPVSARIRRRTETVPGI